jgi:hypothetical protein
MNTKPDCEAKAHSIKSPIQRAIRFYMKSRNIYESYDGLYKTDRPILRWLFAPTYGTLEIELIDMNPCIGIWEDEPVSNLVVDLDGLEDFDETLERSPTILDRIRMRRSSWRIRWA